MPVSTRIVAVVTLMIIFFVTIDPIEEDSVSLLIFYWVTKGSICLCLYLIVGVIFERLFTAPIIKLRNSITILAIQGCLLASLLTMVDLSLEAVLPMKEEYVENPSMYSFFEEMFIHWIALIPLMVVSLFCDPLFLELKRRMLKSDQSSDYGLIESSSKDLKLDTQKEDASEIFDAEAVIYRIEAAEHYVLVFYQDRKEMIKSSFSSFLSRLTELNGLQVHRSHWVNLDQVKGTEKCGRKLQVVMKNGEKLPVSNSFRQAVVDSISV